MMIRSAPPKGGMPSTAFVSSFCRHRHGHFFVFADDPRRLGGNAINLKYCTLSLGCRDSMLQSILRRKYVLLHPLTSFKQTSTAILQYCTSYLGSQPRLRHLFFVHRTSLCEVDLGTEINYLDVSTSQCEVGFWYIFILNP